MRNRSADVSTHGKGVARLGLGGGRLRRVKKWRANVMLFRSFWLALGFMVCGIVRHHQGLDLGLNLFELVLDQVFGVCNLGLQIAP